MHLHARLSDINDWIRGLHCLRSKYFKLGWWQLLLSAGFDTSAEVDSQWVVLKILVFLADTYVDRNVLLGTISPRAYKLLLKHADYQQFYYQSVQI